jgi:hypothetical protein
MVDMTPYQKVLFSFPLSACFAACISPNTNIPADSGEKYHKKVAKA